jgi:hypothetical protein
VITRAIIEEVDHDNSKVRVRIPTLNGIASSSTATPTSQLEWASLIQTPGIVCEYEVGDVVVVGFEDNDYSSPIVLGYLKLSKTDGMKDAKRTHITTTSLSVKENVTLPTNTSFLAPNSTQQVLPFNELWELLQSKQ